jgi:hypothetical protein
MAKEKETPTWIDGFTQLDAGMNSGVAPQILPRNQAAFATNCTFRGNFVTDRPPVRKITLDFGGNGSTQQNFEDKLFQGATYFNPDIGAQALVAAIGGRLFDCSINGTVATIVDATVLADPNPPDVPQAWLWQAESWIIWTDGQSTPVFYNRVQLARRSNASGFIWGRIVITYGPIFAPAVGQYVVVGWAGTGGAPALGTRVFFGADEFEFGGYAFSPSNPNPAAPTIAQQIALGATSPTWKNISAVPGTNYPAGVVIRSVSGGGGTELPVCRMGAYGMGRNWISLPDKRSFLGGDIVGSSTGTAQYNFRDAVLNVASNPFLAAGKTFSVPGQNQAINAMCFATTLDVSLGQGPLEVYTANTVFSCLSPVDDFMWTTITNPILTESLIGAGGLGQNSTIAASGDTISRSLDGIRSLILARRDFDTWGNVPISEEMLRVLPDDDASLLQYSSAIVFDNRMLMTCIPTDGPRGVYHQGLIALNFSPVSSLRGKQPSIYDGFWSELNVLQLLKGQFLGVERAFAFCFNKVNSKIEIWELLPTSKTDHFDNGTTPITWSFESASLMRQVKGKGEFELCRLIDGEIYISDLIGTANFQVFYRPDYDDCWHPWHSFSVCAKNTKPGEPKQYRPRLGLGTPDITKCDPTTNKPFAVGRFFEVRIQVTGHCVIKGVLIKATKEDEQEFAPQVCDPICT